MTRDSRREGLETRLDALKEDHSVLSTVIASEIDEVKKLKKKRELNKIEHEMEDLERELKSLSPKSELPSSPPQPRYQNEQILRFPKS